MIFIDMDGVIANFVGAALIVHQAEVTEKNWPPGQFSMEKVLSITTDQFWNAIDDRLDFFWANLAAYPWMDGLIKAVSATGQPWCILTSPSHKPWCHQGKMRWLHKHFGDHFRDYVFAPAKHKQHLAAPGRILIDDRDSNCIEWDMAGGTAILFPQPWNSAHSLVSKIDSTENRIAWLEAALNIATGRELATSA